MPQPKGRDLEKTRAQLLEWLAGKLPRAEKLRAEGLRGPTDTGFSSDTLIFDLEYEERGEPVRQGMVIRMEPISDFGVFPEYNVALQYQIMKSLADTDVPVPPMLWLEEDRAPLGSRFYVMEKVDGQVPGDNPPYHSQGWVYELEPADRARLWNSALDAMAEVHKLDHRAHQFGFLPQPSEGVAPIEAQLDYWERYLEWGMDRARYDLLNKGFEWLRAHPPSNEPVGICWGDSRISNQIFRDCEAVAVIDWEMVFVGNPVADLAWYITMDRVFTEGIGLERLSGLPDKHATIARWEQRLGRRADHYSYYEVFAAWRYAAIMARLFLQMKYYELVPQDSAVDIENLSTPVLQALLNDVGA